MANFNESFGTSPAPETASGNGKASSLKQELGERMHNLSEKAQHVFDDAKARASSLASDAKSRASSMASSAKSTVSDKASSMSSLMRAHPFATIAIGLCAGYIIARAMRRG